MKKFYQISEREVKMTKIKTATKLLCKKPNKLIRATGGNGLLKFIPDELYLKIVFKAETGYKLNLKNPMTYNEKIQWLKLYDRKPEYSIYADKYLVRKYIENKIGYDYLIPLLGVYENTNEIKWQVLPNRFVLKCTHGSGSNIICKDKANLDIDEAMFKLKKWMHKSWYDFGREWSYKNIIPRIICEAFLKTEDGKSPIDYKFMCFNGEPKLIQVHIDRFSNSYTNDFYDINWCKTKISQGVPNSDIVVPKPKAFDEMYEIAKKLSESMAYVRIDFYEYEGQVKFGEITMYPTSGFTNFGRYEDDLELGSWINLPI